MAVDVLYILGTGSTWADAELRYSLRSLERYGSGVGRIFVTGADPGFLASAVIFTPREDVAGPAHNHADKVLWTIQETDISPDFLVCYDDLFFCAPFAADGYPYYADGAMLPQRANSTKAYRNALANAENILRANGKPTVRFGVHCPVIYNAERFAALRHIWDYAAGMEHGVAVRSVYCNWYGVPVARLRDCKFRTRMTVAELEARIAARHVFSIGDTGLAGGVAEWLTTRFPERSRWEAY